MPYVIATPDVVAAAAMDLAGIRSTLSGANTAAAIPTTGLLAPAADGVSLALAQFFGAHGQAYQSLSSNMAAFHDQFVQAMSAGAGAYASAEATNASPLQALGQAALGVVNDPGASPLGLPLSGNQTTAAAATGDNGGPSGLLWGNAASAGSGALGIPGGNRGDAGLFGGGIGANAAKGGILFGTGGTGTGGVGETNICATGGNAGLFGFGGPGGIGGIGSTGGTGGNVGATSGRGGNGGILFAGGGTGGSGAAGAAGAAGANMLGGRGGILFGGGGLGPPVQPTWDLTPRA